MSNFVQEEIRRNTRDGTSSKGEDEENCALAGKAKKGKGKNSNPKYIETGKKKYLSKIEFSRCYELGHYATKFSHKKTIKKISRGELGEASTS